jgi:hypothetical protein
MLSRQMLLYYTSTTLVNIEVCVAHVLFFRISTKIYKFTITQLYATILSMVFCFQSPMFALKKLCHDASIISRWSIRHLISPHQATASDRQGPSVASSATRLGILVPSRFGR